MRVGRYRLTNHHLPPRMRLKRGVYYYDHGQGEDKKRHWERLSRDLREAKRLWAEIECVDDTPIAGTFAAAVDAYKDSLMLTKAPATQELHQHQSARLRKSFGHMKLSSIRPVHVAQYLDVHKHKVAANREIALMSVIYQLAIRKGWTDINPCMRVSRNPEKARDRYIEDAEFQAVKALASPQMAMVMDLAYLTAMRQGDLLALTVDQLTEEGIRVKQGKTGKRQVIEWSPALWATVEALKALRPKVAGFYLICPRRVRRDSTIGHRYTRTGFSSMWKRLMSKAVQEGKLAERFTFHDIRAKALTDTKRNGCDPQRLAGHTTAKQTETYLRSKEIDRVKPVA